MMADQFVAEIRILPFNFAPNGWAWCDGQLLPLSQNTALFSLLGTTYGGNGESNFALPDLQGRAPMHPGQAPGLSLHDLGETGGSETVTPTGRTLCRSNNGQAWAPPNALSSMSTGVLTPVGGDQPHNNLQPYLTFYFAIALQGIFPPRGT
jgi:microcystin-dependent protein